MQAEQPVITRFENVKGPDFISIYAKNAKFQTGPFDFSFTFGEVTEVNAERHVAIVEQSVRLTMSPLHAKTFAALLVNQLKAFEAQFGKINTPPGLIGTPPKAGTECREKVGHRDLEASLTNLSLEQHPNRTLPILDSGSLCLRARHIMIADEQPRNGSMAENHSSSGFASSLPADPLHHDLCSGCGPGHSLLCRPAGIQSDF